MRNLKKRILSFVSAAAMVATLLPTTALFASAATETETITVSGLPFQNDNSVWDSTEITVTIPTADTYTAQVNYAGNSSGYFKVEIDDVDYFGEGNWLSSNDWSGSAYKTASVSLTAGSHTIRFGGNNYVKFASMTFSHEVEAYSDDLTSTATVIPNNANYGSVSVSTLTKGGDTTVATAANGYMFVGWLIMEDDGSNKKSLSTKKTLKVTGDIANVINTYSNPDIVAQFGKKTRVRYEAEDFVNFISETKYDGKSNKTDEKYFHVHYDDPTVVADNNNTGKEQNWNHSSYSDLQIAPEYSAGGAVALTGPSNGLAIPFSLADDLDEDVEVELGYNYGTLSEWYRNNKEGSSPWGDSGLWVNLYYVSANTDPAAISADWNTFKSVMEGATETWGVSANATVDNASDFLKAQGNLSGPSMYHRLPLTTSEKATLLNSDGSINREVASGDATGVDAGRDTDWATTITLPSGLPAGKYYLSLATDENNYTQYDAYKYWGSNGKDGAGTVDFVNDGTGDTDWNVGTAYYDYIQFYTASTPDMPSPVQVGANFIFKDQWGNDLSSNAFSNSSFSGGKIMFSPEASRYLIVQGWNFKGWDIYEGTVSFDSNGTISGTKTGTISANGNSDIDTACAQLDALQYESGSTYTFVAKYEVQRKTTPVTATNGKIYVKQDSSDTTYTHNDAYGNIAQRFETFSQLRLVANDDTDTQKFSYWTLNGMIYSYDREIYFMTWDAAADFVAVFDTTAASATPTAFINTSHISTSGFDKEANKYHKIEFDCAYYVPSGCTYVSSGIIYTDNTGNIDSVNANNTTISSTGAITVDVSKIIVAANKKYLLFTEDNNGNKYNNQIMVSITNMGFEKTRKARAYLVYKDSNNELHVVYSSGTAQVTTPAWNG